MGKVEKVLLGILLLLLLPGSCPVWGAPSALVAAERDFDFGQVFQGEAVEHVFTFRNGGNAPLVVAKVKSSCGCTAAVVSRTTIPPGGTGELRAVFDSRRFRGNVDKTIYLYLDEPGPSAFQFHLRGEVLLPIELQPELVEWPEARPRVRQKTELVLTNRTKEPIALQEIRSTLAEVHAKLPANPQLGPGESARLMIELTPREGKERLAGYLLIRTDSPLVPELSVPVRVWLSQKAAVPGRP